MAPITFNGSREVATQRKQFYEYTQIQLRAPQDAIECVDGGEIHYDDGSIARLAPGDWAVEGFDGQLRRVARELFHESYVALDDEAAQQRAAEHQPPTAENPDAVALVESPRDEQLPSEPSLPADFQDAEPQTADADRVLTSALEKVQAGDAKNLTAAEKHALQTNRQRQVAEAQKQLKAVIAQALKAKLVDAEEASEWEHTGEPPEGLTITAGPDGYELERERKPRTENPTGAQETDAEGQPE